MSVLTREQEVELMNRIRKGDREAYEKMMMSNIGLVKSIAKNYYGQGAPKEDLDQEGMLGLHRAIEKFNVEKGHKFSTYATWWIRCFVTKELKKYRSVVSVSVKNQLEIEKMNKSISKLKAILGDDPTNEEVAIDMGVTEERVEELLMMKRGTGSVSLEFEMGENGKTIGDTIAATEKKRFEEEIKEYVADISDDLVKRVIVLYFKKERDDPTQYEKTFAEIGDELQITAERARQIVTGYLSYQRNHKNEKLIKSEYPNSLDQFADASFVGIGTGHTVDVYGSMKSWADTEEQNHMGKNWELFYDSTDTIHLIENITCTDFHVYFVRYLVERFSNMLPDITAEMVETDLEKRKLLEKIVKEECIRNGFTKGVPLEKCLTEKSISKKDFFTMALALDMSLEDVEAFCQKVLLRNTWDLFDVEEVILYITFKYAKGNKQEFICRAKEVYENVKPRKLWNDQQAFNTIVYKTLMDRMLDAIDDNIMVFDSDDEVVEQLSDLFAHVKYMMEESEYQRSANEKFVELYEEFLTYTEADRKRVIKEATGNVVGDVDVFYDCREGLEIKAGQRFFKESDHGNIPYVVTKDVSLEKTNAFAIEVKVTCSKKLSASEKKSKDEKCVWVPKQSEFQHDLIYVTKAMNKSMFKTAGGSKDSVQITGKVYLQCDASQCDIYNQVIPKGTIFKYQDLTFSVEEETSLMPMTQVEVSGAEEAKQDQIQVLEGQEKYPQIIGMKHAKISHKKAARKELKAKSAGSDMPTKSEVSENLYLYHTSGGRNSYQMNFMEREKGRIIREKLLEIMKGTAVDLYFKRKTIKERTDKKLCVDRQELLTMAFLTEMAREQFTVSKERIADAQERLANRIQRMNFILNSCGFYGVYPVNPYDCLMLYISTFEREPIYVYRNLWGNLQDFVNEKE